MPSVATCVIGGPPPKPHGYARIATKRGTDAIGLGADPLRGTVSSPIWPPTDLGDVDSDFLPDAIHVPSSGWGIVDGDSGLLFVVPKRPGTHIDDPAAVGARVRAARERAGLSQRQLSFEGCTPAYVSRVEAGKRIPSLQILREFANRLKVDVDYLAYGAASRPNLDLIDADLEVRLGDPERAIEIYESLRDRDRDRGRTDAASKRAALGLGVAALKAGRTTEAIERLEPLVAGGDLAPADEAAAADALGRAYAFRGELEAAIATFRRYLDAANERADLVERIRFSVLLANALVDAGDTGRASEVLGDVLDDVDQITDRTARAALLWTRSRLHARDDHLDLAEHYAGLAHDALRLAEQELYEAELFQLAAHIQNDRSEPVRALELLDRGLPVVRASGNPLHVALFDVERARALLALGDREQAAAIAATAGSALAEKSPVDAGRAYALLGHIFRDLGETARAVEVYELAAEMLDSSPDRLRVEVYAGLAEIFEAEGDADAALRALRRALANEPRAVSAGP
jgi:tetratricopeptide (TPR) repeat protein